jgi:hypothetical protein
MAGLTERALGGRMQSRRGRVRGPLGGRAGAGRHIPRTSRTVTWRFRFSDWTTGWGRDGPLERYLSAGAHRSPTPGPCASPAAYHFNCAFTARHPETEGANRSESERASARWLAGPFRLPALAPRLLASPVPGARRAAAAPPSAPGPCCGRRPSWRARRSSWTPPGRSTPPSTAGPPGATPTDLDPDHRPQAGHRAAGSPVSGWRAFELCGAISWPGGTRKHRSGGPVPHPRRGPGAAVR